jgi:hypothetical protein
VDVISLDLIREWVKGENLSTTTSKRGIR